LQLVRIKNQVKGESIMSENISRRDFLSIVGASVSSISLLKGDNHKSSQDSPNIIWLMADDAGLQDFGCYGHPVLKTPNIDKLAREGVKFTQAFVTSPQCSPSRTSCFTGKYAHTMGTEDLHSPLPESEKVLPQYLKPRNYYTGNVGKLHLGKDAKDKFDFIMKDVDKWRKFLRERPKNRPFFLCLGYHEPHRPYKIKRNSKEYQKDDTVVPPYLPDKKRVRKDLARYYNQIHKLDTRVGKILQALEKRNLAENTIVLFWSDNGPPFPRAKGFLYDTGIATPLIIRWKEKLEPGIRRGLVSIVDFVPTMLDMVDIDIPDEIQGKSFYKHLKGENHSFRDYIFTERNWHDLDDHVRSVRTNRYKYIRNYYPDEPYTLPSDVFGSPTFKAMKKAWNNNNLPYRKRLLFKRKPREELYDLQNDPNEFYNLVNREGYQEIKYNLKKRVEKWEERTDDVPISKTKKDNYNPKKILK